MQTQTINCICTLHMLATDHAHRPRAPEYIQSEYIRAHAYSAKRTLIRPSSRTLGGAHTCKRTTFSCMHMEGCERVRTPALPSLPPPTGAYLPQICCDRDQIWG